jgi:hypothetical protein
VPATAYSYQDPGNDGRAHSYQVRAYAGTTVALVSAPSPTTTEPPLNLYRAGQGQVCWSPVVAHNGPGDGYHVYAGGTMPIDSANAAGHDPNTPVCWAPHGSYYQNSWAPGSTHAINVATYNTGVNGGADESEWSDPLSYVFVPAPAGVQLWNECDRFWQIIWSPVPDAATYSIYANGTLIAKGLTTDYYGYSYEFTSPLNETYTVTAVDAQGNESVPSAPVSTPVWD